MTNELPSFISSALLKKLKKKSILDTIHVWAVPVSKVENFKFLENMYKRRSGLFIQTRDGRVLKYYVYGKSIKKGKVDFWDLHPTKDTLESNPATEQVVIRIFNR